MASAKSDKIKPASDSAPKPLTPKGYTREDALSDTLERLRFPVMFIGLLALIGASRFDMTRPYLGMFLALMVPCGAVIAGAAPLRDSGQPLRLVGFGVAAAVLLLSELEVGTAIFAKSVAVQRTEASIAFGVLALLAIFVEAFAGRNGLKTRFAACMGIAAGLALYLPGRIDPKEALGAVLAGLLVAVFIGGGLGLFLGAAAAKLAR
jgi:hypothetical protein